MAGKSCKIRAMVAYFSSKFSKQTQSAVAALLLVFCLLGTAWVGLAHSISHANQQYQSLEKAPVPETYKNVSHSAEVCHLFDALTLAGFLPSTNFASLIVSNPSLEKHSFERQRLGTYQHASYLSRAPPIFIL